MIESKSSNQARNTRPGSGRMYSGFHPDQTTTCQIPKAIAIASSFGHSDDQMRVHGLGFGGSTISSASRPERSAVTRSVVVVPVRSRITMAAYLLAQTLGDLRGPA